MLENQPVGDTDALVLRYHAAPAEHHVARWRPSTTRTLRDYFSALVQTSWPRLHVPGWSRLVQSLAVRAMRRAIARTLGVLLRIAVAGTVAIVLGLGSAWYFIDVGSGLTVGASGPWRIWSAAGRPDADPYTRAHFARLGWLSLASTEVQTYAASIDSEGRKLYADCEYDVIGPIPDAQWWSLAVFNPRGELLDVPADRHVISRGTIVPDSGGRMVIRLASDARPGNWLPTLGGNAMVLVLRLQGSVIPGGGRGENTIPVLPVINQLSCR
jgi:hypothetical protein